MSGIRIPTFVETLSVARAHGRNSCAPYLWDGAAALYPFNQGAGKDLFDVLRYAGKGTLTNMDPATDWVPTEKGRMLEFAGGSSNETILFDAAISIGTTHTLSWWGDCQDDTCYIFGGAVYAITALHATRFYYLTDAGNSCWVLHGGYTGMHHWATVRQGTGVEFYKDSVSLGSAVLGADTATAITHISGFGVIGDTTPDNEYDGLLGNLVAHLRTLTPSEIQQLADPVACWDMYRLRSPMFAATAAAPGIVVSPYYYTNLLAGV